LAKELFEKVINKSIDEFLGDVFMNKNANLYKEIASIAMAFMEFERLCFEVEKPAKINSKNEKLADELINLVDEILKAKEQDKNAN
ncbi:hypothetical protein PO80_12320, partial [Vibrio parahaemolyticus]|uniref:hypothetical protein n=1 Tax=Vibrio parahaemolyticus TaxID=670 RepID=UPI0005424517